MTSTDGDASVNKSKYLKVRVKTCEGFLVEERRKSIHLAFGAALRLRWGLNSLQIEGKIEEKQLNLSRINVFNLQFHSLLSFIF